MRHHEADLPPTTLAPVLERLARELATLAETSREIETAVSHRISPDAGGANPDDLRDIQNLDLMTQTLAELAAFVDCLAATDAASQPGADIDVEQLTAPLTLSRLAARLRGKQTAPISDHGEFDAF